MPKANELITPQDVLDLEAPTDDFLCPLTANIYNLTFLNFEIINYETKKVIFEIGRNTTRQQIDLAKLAMMDEKSLRTINYEFPEEFLRLPTVQTSLMFSVGNKEVHNFRMIERHYFRDELIKSYDFKFGFCIPNSTNTWDAVYDLPPLEEHIIQNMIDHPYETTSDTFYFADNKLIMHNKARYKYLPTAEAQAKDSPTSSKKQRPAKGQKGSKDDDDDDDDDDAKGAKQRDHKWSKEEDYK